jgi:predicted component of type VI protein secretion system
MEERSMDAALNGPQGRITLGPAPLTLGRAPDNQLVLSDVKTSSHHAEIRPDAQGYVIIDLGSTNGTFVNGQRLEPHLPRVLHANDIIHIGDTNFTYETNMVTTLPPTVYISENDQSFQSTMAAPPSAYPATVAAPSPGPQEYQQIPPPPVYNQPSPSPSPYNVAPYPNYDAMQPPPQQRSRRGLWITLGIIGAVVLLLCVVGILAYAGRSTPTKTMTTFCNDLTSSNFHDAYRQLSSRVQSQESEATFTSNAQQAVSAGGGLKSCTVGAVNDNGTTGTGVMTWLFNAAPQPLLVDTSLINENGVWKIDVLRVRGS